nr:hypothetical protein [Pseudoalteromonas sp. MMG006]
MFITEFFGFFSLSAFAMWGFLMAFFFNVFVFSLNIKRNTTLLLSSLIMMVSYTTSDYFYTWLSIHNTTYLDWAFYDLTTIFSLWLCSMFIKIKTPSFLYLIVGLTINSIFFVFMHLDMYLLKNYEPWLFWDIYTFTVNFIDFVMIVSLIVDRDFLGLHKLKNKLLGLFKSQKPQPTT